MSRLACGRRMMMLNMGCAANVVAVLVFKAFTATIMVHHGSHGLCCSIFLVLRDVGVVVSLTFQVVPANVVATRAAEVFEQNDAMWGFTVFEAARDNALRRVTLLGSLLVTKEQRNKGAGITSSWICSKKAMCPV